MCDKGDKKMATKVVTDDEYYTPIKITADQARQILQTKPTKVKPTHSAMWNLSASKQEKDEFVAKIMRTSRRGKH